MIHGVHMQNNIRAVECCDGITWSTFKDGWPNIFINDVDSIAGKDSKMNVQYNIYIYQMFVYMYNII